MSRPERMGREPMLRLIVSFTLPSIAGMLAHALYNIVDRMFVGRVVGTMGLAAISVCFPFMIFLLSFCLLLGVGAVPTISGSLGEGDPDRAERILANVIMAAAVVGSAIAIVAYLMIDPLLRLSGADATILPSAREYLRIILLGAPFGTLSFVMNFCIRAEGRPRFAMATQVLGALSNVALDALFVWRLGWGVAGAAWGTIISQMISLLWVSSFYWRRAGHVRFRLAHCIPRVGILSRLVAIGFPSALTEVSFSLFFVLFNQALAHHSGPIAVSALGAFMGWDSLLFMPVVGICEGVQAIFGFNWGARRPMRVMEALKMALILSAAYFTASAIVVHFFLEDMMRMFSTDPLMLAVAVPGGRMAYAAVVLAGLAMVANSFFQGLGLAGLSLFLSLCRQFVFLIPALLIMPRLFGAVGVWGSFAVLDAAGGALGTWLLLRQCRRLGLLRYEARWAALHRAKTIGSSSRRERCVEDA